MADFNYDFEDKNDFDEKKSSPSVNTEYNIEKVSFNTYEVVMVVAGYNKSDIDIIFKDGVLKVKAKLKKEHTSSKKEYIHKGFIIKPFENSFSLSNKLEVTGASLRDGILTITLKDRSSQKDLISPID